MHEGRNSAQGTDVSEKSAENSYNSDSLPNIVCGPSNNQTDTIGDGAIRSNDATDENRPLNGVHESGSGSQTASIGLDDKQVGGSIKNEIVFLNEPDLRIDVGDYELEVIRDVIAYDSDEDPEAMIEIEYSHLSFHPRRIVKNVNDDYDLVTGNIFVEVNVRSNKDD